MTLRANTKFYTPNMMVNKNNISFLFYVVSEDNNNYYGYHNNRYTYVNKTNIESIEPTTLKTNSVGKYGGSSLLTQRTRSSYGTVVAPVFPDISSDWYYYGFPSKVAVASTLGSIVAVIPLDVYAVNSGSLYFGLGTPPDRYGYLDQNGAFSTTFYKNMQFKAGDYLFTILLKKEFYPLTQLNVNSYWNLLMEISGVDAGSTSSMNISMTSGMSSSQTTEFGISIGSTIGFEAGTDFAKVTAQLSIELSASFSTTVEVNQSLTTSATVDFQSQLKDQRIACYQFIEGYSISLGQDIINLVNSFNQNGGGFGANWLKAQVSTYQAPYATNYFRKAYVLSQT